MTVTEDLAELGARIEEQVAETLRLPALDAARALANEAGLVRARGVLRDAPALLSAAQEAYRSCQQREAEAKEFYETALAEAEWELDESFVTEGNKTYLVLADDKRQAMTADERAKWKTMAARKAPAVAGAAEALRKAEAERQAGADGVAYAERCFTAARLEVEAAIAQLAALTTAIGRN